MKKKVLTIAIALVLCLGLLAVTASAAEAEYKYVEYSWDSTSGLTSAEKTVPAGYTLIDGIDDPTTWNGWYVVTGEVTISSRITVSGTAHLILTDGCKLNASRGISVDLNKTLVIYGQTEGTGSLTATGGNFQAGIGGSSYEKYAGTITIHGGTVTARGSHAAAGIGGGSSSKSWGSDGGIGGTVTIYHGTVTATGGSGGDGGAGIGGGGDYAGGYGAYGGATYIYGGVVNAYGGGSTADAIGRGGESEGYYHASPPKDYSYYVPEETYLYGGIITADGVCKPKTSSNCIHFTGSTGQVYGSYTFEDDYTLSQELTVPEGASLTIPAGVTLSVTGSITNNGTIINNGTLILQSKEKLTGSGTLDGNGAWQLALTSDMISVPEGLVYNGQDRTEAAKSAIKLPDPAPTETIFGNTFTCITEGWTYTLSPKTVKDAGTYTVTYSKTGYDNVTKTFAVAQKYITITGAAVNVGAFAPMTYDGTEQVPQAAVTVDRLEVTGSWSGVTNVTDATTFTANGNFTGTLTGYPTSMARKAITATVAAADKFWDGSTTATVIAAVDTGVDGETITISGLSGTFASTEPASGIAVAVDETNVTYAGTANLANYDVTIPDSTTAAIQVIPLSIIGVKMTADSYTYGDTVGYDNTNVSITRPGGATAHAADLVYTYTGTANDGSPWNDTTAPTKAGSYTLTVSHSDTDHYSGKQELSFTIERKPITEPAQATAVTYNGAEQTYAVTETEYYSVASGVKTAANESGYDVTVSLKDKNNYKWKTSGKTDDLTHKFVINKAPVTITAKDQSYHIGNDLPETVEPDKHYTIEGLMEGDSIGTVTIEYWLDSEKVTPDKNRVETYEIRMAVADPNANYEITYVYGELSYYYTPRYEPVVEEAEGVDVAVSPRYPVQGQTVTVTVTPDDGTEVSGITVTDKDGKPVEVTDNGDGTYSFRQPNGKVTISVEKVCTGSGECPSLAYSDLNTGLWYHEATDYVIRKGLMNGIGGGKFDPTGTTSRAMIVTILWRLEGEPVYGQGKSGTFADVPEDQWYTEAVEWAAANGIVEGWNGSFDPNSDITREQFATILWRYAKYKGYDVSVGEDTNILSYEDAFSISEWAVPAMQWACGAGIMEGDGVNLTPKADATRAQAAALFQRFCEK